MIAVIGVIVAIAIPAFGRILESSREAKARRNAQLIASIYTAALSAGAPVNTTSLDTVIAGLLSGVTPTSGAYAGRQFRISSLSPGEVTAAKRYLTEPSTGGLMLYNPGESDL